MKMVFHKPAELWTEGFPIGNGRLGAMVYGHPQREILKMNEDTLWSGCPETQQKGMTSDCVKQARELAAEGKYKQSMEVLEEALKEGFDTQMYQPFGNLILDFQGERTITDYRRELDLDNAVVRVEYRNAGKRYEHTCFSSAPAQGIVYRIVAEEPFSLRIYGEEGFLTRQSFASDGFKFYGQCPGRNGFTVGGTEKGDAQDFINQMKLEGILYEGWGRVTATGGEIKPDGDGLLCENVTELRIDFAVRSSFHGFQKHPVTEGLCSAELLQKDMELLQRPFKQILEEHQEEYRRYFSRVSLHLGESGKEEMDIEERVALLHQGEEDASLYALMFDYGRYLLISSSRPGTQAANLQGIWNEDKIPAWFSAYTVNINLQMNYWMTGPCNLHELIDPMVVLNEELLESGKETAQQLFGCEGVACCHNTDIWRKTSPATGRAMWAYWPFGAAWMCRNLYDEYLFCQDEKYLARILPILKENVIFCEQMLTKTEKGYAVCPATSPENTFLMEQQSISVAYYTENVMAIIRNLFRDYIEACSILGVEEGFAGKIQEKLQEMVPIAIGKHGQIMEWNEDFEEQDEHHRHLSQLYELHPGRGIHQGTPALFKAARTSLLRRGDKGTGWSIAWKLLMWARMEDGEHIASLMKHMFNPVPADEKHHAHPGGVYPNLLSAHPPFQIDGNLGFTAGIAEMLLQSHQDEIVLLPAILPEWKTGEVRGLIARGGIRVDIAWTDNYVKYTLVSFKDQNVKVRVKGQEAQYIHLTKGAFYEAISES